MMKTYTTTGFRAFNCASEEEFLERFKKFLFKIRPNRGRKAKENLVKNLVALEAARKDYKIS